MPIKLISGAGGSLTVQPASTASNYTLTVPAVTANVVTTGDSNTITQTMVNQSSFYAGYGPAFSAYNASGQTLAFNTVTKIQFNTEVYDTANCYDPTTNYRFTPNVAGYYQINIAADFVRNATRAYFLALYLHKNGSYWKYTGMSMAAATGSEDVLRLTTLVYMNGSSDYLESYAYQYDYTSGSSITLATSPNIQGEFSGFLARAS